MYVDSIEKAESDTQVTSFAVPSRVQTADNPRTQLPAVCTSHAVTALFCMIDRDKAVYWLPFHVFHRTPKVCVNSYCTVDVRQHLPVAKRCLHVHVD